jgi:hypothetical protein
MMRNLKKLFLVVLVMGAMFGAFNPAYAESLASFLPTPVSYNSDGASNVSISAITAIAGNNSGLMVYAYSQHLIEQSVTTATGMIFGMTDSFYHDQSVASQVLCIMNAAFQQTLLMNLMSGMSSNPSGATSVENVAPVIAQTNGCNNSGSSLDSSITQYLQTVAH